MLALKEITEWKDGSTSNHTYLLDGDKMVAYIRKGTTEPFYFKSPIKGFSRSYRKFVELKGAEDPFNAVEVKSELIEVKGSKGNTYFVDPESHTCTCPGFTFRGACKHIEELK
jgi:hypothetical protein